MSASRSAPLTALHSRRATSNFGPLIDLFLGRTREPLIAQAFLPAVAEGDKRIILIDGDPIGGFNRVPMKGHARSNLAVGGTAQPSDLSEADLAICAAIGPDKGANPHRFDLSFTVKVNGTVTDASAKVDNHSPEVEGCATNVVRNLLFRARTKGKPEPVTHSIVIERRQ